MVLPTGSLDAGHAPFTELTHTLRRVRVQAPGQLRLEVVVPGGRHRHGGDAGGVGRDVRVAAVDGGAHGGRFGAHRVGRRECRRAGPLDDGHVAGPRRRAGRRAQLELRCSAAGTR